MELRKKILAKDFAITHWIPSALMISGPVPWKAAAEVLSGNNDIARLDLSCKLRAERTESVLFHIVNGL